MFFTERVPPFWVSETARLMKQHQDFHHLHLRYCIALLEPAQSEKISNTQATSPFKISFFSQQQNQYCLFPCGPKQHRAKQYFRNSPRVRSHGRRRGPGPPRKAERPGPRRAPTTELSTLLCGCQLKANPFSPVLCALARNRIKRARLWA